MCALIGSALLGVAAYLVVRSTNPDVIQALNTSARLSLTFVWFPLTLLIATTALVSLRRLIEMVGHVLCIGLADPRPSHSQP